VTWQSSRPAKILFVDTEDRCRAPAAAALANAFADEIGVPIECASAGVAAASGDKVTFVLRRVAGAALDLEGHRAKQLTEDAVHGHDLVVCMQRRHVALVQEIAPGTLPFTFAYSELADLAHDLRGAGMGLAMWLPVLHDHRRRVDLLTGPSDATAPDAWLVEPGDVADPRSHLPKGVRQMLRDLDELTGRLIPRVAETGGILPTATGRVRRGFATWDDRMLLPA
jgi:protein-tyrosine-phosphatase